MQTTLKQKKWLKQLSYLMLCTTLAACGDGKNDNTAESQSTASVPQLTPAVGTNLDRKSVV